MIKRQYCIAFMCIACLLYASRLTDFSLFSVTFVLALSRKNIHKNRTQHTKNKQEAYNAQEYIIFSLFLYHLSWYKEMFVQGDARFEKRIIGHSAFHQQSIFAWKTDLHTY